MANNMQDYKELFNKYKSQLKVPNGYYLGIHVDCSKLFLFNKNSTAVDEFSTNDSMSDIQERLNRII